VVYSVRMRRLSERARLEGELALRKALEGVRRSPGAAIAAGDEFIRTSLFDRGSDLSRSWLHAVDRETAAREGGDDIDLDVPATRMVEAVAPMYEPTTRDELLEGLDRVADAIERVAAQLDSYHQERAEHLDAIEFLLREIVMGTVSAPGNRSTVLGGVIDGRTLDPQEREISLVPDDYGLEVDAVVEVRSRFHDRWIGGFTIAEAVNTPGRHRYRLTRRSDGIPLPILFDACDVRAASDHDRQTATS
jgi:hypothetical protein